MKYKIIRMLFIVVLLGTTTSMAYAQKKKKDKTKEHADSPIENYDLSYLKGGEFDEFSLDIDLDEDATNYLLIIAVDNYTSWKPLRNPVKDAQDVRDLLIERYTFESENIFEIYNDDVTAESVIEKFEEITEVITASDNLLIYYSGHGFYDAAFDEGYWIPYNGVIGHKSTYIPNTTVLNYLKNINSKHTFLIADACFSGALFSDAHRGYVENAYQMKSRWGLSSGNLEFVSDGSEEDTNSPFAKYLLTYLRENIKDKLLVSEVIQYVKVTVADNTNQQPVGAPLRNVGNEGGEFIFHLRQ